MQHMSLGKVGVIGMNNKWKTLFASTKVIFSSFTLCLRLFEAKTIVFSFQKDLEICQVPFLKDHPVAFSTRAIGLN